MTEVEQPSPANAQLLLPFNEPERAERACELCGEPVFDLKRYCSKRCKSVSWRERRFKSKNDAPTSVYKYYDGDGVLLYVGVTGRGSSRNVEHNKTKSWWQFVDRQSVEHHKTRNQALQREYTLIRKLAPPFNVQQNPDHVAAREAYLLRRNFGGQKGVDLLITGRNRVPAPLINTVGDRVTFAVMDPRVNLDEADALRVDTHGRKGALLDSGVFADGSAMWIRIKTLDAEKCTGAIVMYKVVSETSWPAKVIQPVYQREPMEVVR